MSFDWPDDFPRVPEETWAHAQLEELARIRAVVFA